MGREYVFHSSLYPWCSGSLLEIFHASAMELPTETPCQLLDKNVYRIKSLKLILLDA